MKKLPLGISSFPKLRDKDCLYIDKTAKIQELIEQYQYVLFSRPRRFGKSLLTSTLQSLFEGKREFFKGLSIDDSYDWSTSYPVIHLSLSGRHNTLENSEKTLLNKLHHNAKRLGVGDCEENLSSNFFYDLIIGTHEKHQQKVVILIDEYDKPLLDNITKEETALEIRDLLQAFYGTIKDLDELIHFVFLTGITKFSKTSIFSGLNNLIDISLDPLYATLCGYTQNDLENCFAQHLEGVDWDKLRLWYNGYNFSDSLDHHKKELVYNPYDILLFIEKNHRYKNYWFKTGTPNFLIELLKRKHYYLPELDGIEVSEDAFEAFDIEEIQLKPLLFQAGYLTIDKVTKTSYHSDLYHLKVPNKEVRLSLVERMLRVFANHSNTEQQYYSDSLKKALRDGDMQTLKRLLQKIYANFPYELYSSTPLAQYEGHYCSILYGYLVSLRADVQLEKSTNKGRIDMVVTLRHKRYLIEFKIEGEDNALEQIKEKEYFQAFYDTEKELYLLGIHFDPQERNLTTFEWERRK